MRNPTRSAAVFFGVASCLGIVAGHGPASRYAQAEDIPPARNAERLAERVTRLERMVSDDPLHPRDTVLARLDAVEDRLREMAKADEAAVKGGAKSMEKLEKDLDQYQRGLAELDRRLKAIERGERGGRGDEPDVDQLRRDVAQLQRSVDDLRGRIGRIESKR